jgi:hypothetical protein
VPDEYRKKITDTKRLAANQILGDKVLEISQDKKVVWEWHMYKHLDINRYCKICNIADWTHTNTIQALPENKWYEGGDKRFKPGNILLSPRNLGFIFIVDKDSKEIVWEYSGNYAGGLSGQHEPHMIEKGLSGEGNIVIFDNGAPPYRSIAHTGCSIVLEINPLTKEIVWKYEDGYWDRRKFYSAFQSSVQRLQNGNTLICEYGTPRIFEVTVEGEIVWEYALKREEHVGRAYRYSYNYCPQLKSAEEPEEKRVLPPSHVITRTIGRKPSRQLERPKQTRVTTRTRVAHTAPRIE